jgi:hypothetical protein
VFVGKAGTSQKKFAIKQDLEDKLNDPDEGIFCSMQLYLAFMGKKNLECIFPQL